MAVRDLFISIGQSNAGTQADYATWQLLHPGLAVDFAALSSDYAQGSYTDRFVMPGNFPGYELVNLKGRAVQAIRYLHAFHPGCTSLVGGFCYPHTTRVTAATVLAGIPGTAVTMSTTFQYDPTGQVFTRRGYGTQHTVAFWSALAPNQVLLTPAFDPVAVAGEELDYPITAGTNSPNATTLRLTPLIGGDYGTAIISGTPYGTTWRGSLKGARIRCTSGANSGDWRWCKDIALNSGVTSDAGLPCVELTVTEAWDSTPADGDAFVIEPPPLADGSAVPWQEWAYWLPWSPLEGQALEAEITVTGASSPSSGVVRLACTNATVVAGNKIQLVGTVDYDGEHVVVAATPTSVDIYETFTSTKTGVIRRFGKQNPYPPGFNFPSHHEIPVLYQPFPGPTFMYGPSAAFDSARAAYHVGVASRLHEALGGPVYVLSLAVDGTTLSHNELYAAAVNGFAWFDPKQQTSWAPGEPNGCFARFVALLRAGVNAAAAQGDTLRLRLIVGVQGEGDASFEWSAIRYKDALTRFVAAVRQACVDAGVWTDPARTIPFVWPEISTSPWPFAATVNAAIREVVAADPYMRTFSTADLTKIVGDTAHYDAVGITNLELRVVDAWRDLSTSSGADFDALWEAVKARYDSRGLVQLTNIRDRAATTIDETVGREAAASVIALWPAHVQAVYDPNDTQHVEVAVLGVVAMLWRRGGSSSAIEQVKWDEVFGPEGLVQKLRRTGARGRAAPASNSGVRQAPEAVGGVRVRDWADRESLPPGVLARRQSAEDMP